MIKRLEIYNGTKTYMYPTGVIATPEIMEANYPAIKTFAHVIETDGEVCYSIHNLNSFRISNNIDATLTDDEAIAKLQDIINTPVTVTTPPPTTEERIASALEYQNLIS